MKKILILLFSLAFMFLVFSGAMAATTAELLTGASQSSWTDNDAPYKTWYKDSRAQSIYLKTDLEAAGISGSVIIDEVCFYCSETPGKDIVNLRIRMQNTSLTSLSSFATTTSWTTVYGPQTYAAPAAGTWKCHTLSSAFIWDGASNLMVDVYRNDDVYVNGGGNYVRSTGASRTYAGYSDNIVDCGPGEDCNNPAVQSSPTGSAFNHVLSMKLSYNHVPGVPVLNSPADGTTGVDINPDLMFDYSDSDNDSCFKFDIQVDDNSDFSSPEINVVDYSTGGPWASGSTITYPVSTDLSPLTQYYWKARVYDGANWSNSSDGDWDFTVREVIDPAVFTVKKSNGCDCASSTECYSGNCSGEVCADVSPAYIENTTSTSPSSTSAYCPNEGGGRVTFSWDYKNDGDHNMHHFIFQASASTDFSPANLIVDTTTTVSYPPNTNVIYSVDVRATQLENKLVYGGSYYWRVKVCDDQNNCSEYINASEQAETAPHLYPSPGFTWTPQDPTKNEIIQFCAIDEGNCTSTLSGDKTICYDGSNDPILGCPDGNFQWSIDPSADVEFVDGTTPTSSNPRIRIPDDATVTLDITDGDGFGCCSTSTFLGIKPPIPEYKEISPLGSVFKSALASMLSSVRGLAFLFF